MRYVRRVAPIGLLIAIVVFSLTLLGRDLAFHAVPIRWTGEPARLAEILGISPGSEVAELGAGSGALIVELATSVAPGGRAFATERTADQRSAIMKRALDRDVDVVVLAAPDLATNLPDACCDAIVMRMVLHHIADVRLYAHSVRRAVKPGGRVAIIDFAPGALPHLTDSHGVAADRVVEAFGEAGFALTGRDATWGGRTYLVVFTPIAEP